MCRLRRKPGGIPTLSVRLIVGQRYGGLDVTFPFASYIVFEILYNQLAASARELAVHHLLRSQPKLKYSYSYR